jgi:hypothetical protein
MALATAIEFSPHFAHLERDKLQVLASRSAKSSLLSSSFPAHFNVRYPLAHNLISPITDHISQHISM